MIGIGLDYDKLGKPVEARKWFDKALSTDSSIAKSLANAGLALSNSSDYQRIVSWLDRVIVTDLNDLLSAVSANDGCESELTLQIMIEYEETELLELVLSTTLASQTHSS